MTSKSDYSEAEWTRLKRAPFLAGMAVSLADPGGPIEAVKESAATLKSVLSAADSADHGALAQAIALDVRDDASRRKTPMAGFKPASGATAGVEILDELREVDRLAAEKASADEADDLRVWLVEIAQDAANAAKEGGFMGFRAVRVSEGEQRMLDQLRQVLATRAN